ncbi:hypothetical protein KJ713_00030 [Patescibacteria group bacterium]|nr:hypothetical protein [Patescibacteria group bacterium]
MFKYWYLKLLALILAIILWFVAWGMSSATKEIKTVPIEVKNLKGDLAYALDNYQVDIKVVAKKDKLDNLKAEDFTVSIDLGNWEKGTYNQEPEIKSPSGVEVISVSPDNFIVRIEDRAEKEVGLSTKIEGLPADGYLVGSSQVKPERATASGPKSEIESLNKGTIKIALSGEKESFNRDLKIFALDSQGRDIPSISFKPQKVQTSLFIFSGSNNKAVGIKPKISGTPLAGYWISGVLTLPSTIIINSDSELLLGIDSIETSIYDITGLSKNKEGAVSLIFPPGVSSIENIKEVKIRFELSSIEMTRELYGSINFINTPLSRRVTRINSENIRVIISGPLNLTRTMTSSDIKIEIDLTGKEKGESRIELKTDNIKVPEGIGVVSFLPNVIEITIE